MFKQGDTLAITKSFNAGRRTFKAHTAAWITGTNKSHSSTCPEGAVILGKMRDSIGQGVCIRISDLEQYAKLEL